MGRDDLHENTADHATDAMIVKIGDLVAFRFDFEKGRRGFSSFASSSSLFAFYSRTPTD